jgi:hypothetical protein
MLNIEMFGRNKNVLKNGLDPARHLPLRINFSLLSQLKIEEVTI